MLHTPATADVSARWILDGKGIVPQRAGYHALHADSPTPSTPLRNSRPRRLPQPVDRLLPLLHATGKACPSKIAQRLKLSKGFGSPVHQSRRFGVSLLIGTSHSSESIYRAGHKPGRIADVEAGPLDTASVGGLL